MVKANGGRNQMTQMLQTALSKNDYATNLKESIEEIRKMDTVSFTGRVEMSSKETIKMILGRVMERCTG
jgi:hypothetical protein